MEYYSAIKRNKLLNQSRYKLDKTQKYAKWKEKKVAILYHSIYVKRPRGKLERQKADQQLFTIGSGRRD